MKVAATTCISTLKLNFSPDLGSILGSLPGHTTYAVAATISKLKLNFSPVRGSILMQFRLIEPPEVQLAQASIHVTCVCTYVDTMYISNLYMYRKSFEVPTMRSHARKRKYLFGTSGDACVIFREVWEMNITFCFKSTFCRQILS